LTEKVVKSTILINNPKLARQTKIIEQFLEQRKHNEKTGDNIILWIETLLRTPISESRKYAGWRILAPYLINVRHLSDDDAFVVIDRWLSKCNKLEELDFDVDAKINSWLNGAVSKGYLPISFDNPDKEPKTLKTENRELYDALC
jgi:hypothetical protein